MSLFSELKRRNVFKVGIAYIALGWVVIQATDIIVPALNLPDTINTIVVYFGLIGFPFALFFAWAFELTPDGMVRADEVDQESSITYSTGRKLDFAIIGLMALAISFLIYDRGSEPEEVSVAETVLENTVAVLPFADMSPDGSQEYFGDGIAEEILNVLVSVDELDVTSRTSAFALKGQNLLIPEIAAKLNVNYIVEGSIRSAGNRIRVTAQLINVASDQHMWSQTYDRELTDIFAIQDEISRAIADALKIELVGYAVGREAPTDNMDAYQLYLRGHELFLSRELENLLEAISLLEQAVELDPDFAEGWAELSASRIVLPGYGNVNDLDALIERANIEADKALSLNPELAQAWAAKGAVLYELLEWEDALKAARRSVELNPNNDTAWLWLADDLSIKGYIKEAEQAFLRAIELAPNVVINQELYSYNLFFQNRIDEARNRILNKIPPSRKSYMKSNLLMELAIREKDKNEYLRHYKSIASIYGSLPESIIGQYFDAYFDASLREALRGDLMKALENNHPLLFVKIYLLLDGEGFVLYFKTRKSGSVTLLRALYSPLFRPMLNQDVVKDYLKEIGLVDYWRETKFPDFCQAVGDDDFECQDGEGNWP